MPSTFECPFCKSRYNRWVASVYDDSVGTDTTTHQCKQCLNLFDIVWQCWDEKETSEEPILM